MFLASPRPITRRTKALARSNSRNTAFLWILQANIRHFTAPTISATKKCGRTSTRESGDRIFALDGFDAHLALRAILGIRKERATALTHALGHFGWISLKAVDYIPVFTPFFWMASSGVLVVIARGWHWARE